MGLGPYRNGRHWPITSTDGSWASTVNVTPLRPAEGKFLARPKPGETVLVSLEMTPEQVKRRLEASIAKGGWL